MKKILILSLTLLVTLTTFAEGKKTKWWKKSKKQVELVTEPVSLLVNDVDSMSYALATNYATELVNNFKTLPFGAFNKDLFLVAFNAVMDGDTLLLLTQEQSQQVLQEYFTSAYQRLEQEQMKEGQKFLEDNAKNPAVQATESGLQYIILREGNGQKPEETDKVRVHYEGTLIDGTVFDSSYDRGEPTEFILNQVIPGWTEGVQLMSEGAKYKLFIPYDLAYGEQGAQGVIPPYATLIFTVELLAINPASITDQIKPLEIE